MRAESMAMWAIHGSLRIGEGKRRWRREEEPRPIWHGELVWAIRIADGRWQLESKCRQRSQGDRWSLIEDKLKNRWRECRGLRKDLRPAVEKGKKQTRKNKKRKSNKQNKYKQINNKNNNLIINNKIIIIIRRNNYKQNN